MADTLVRAVVDVGEQGVPPLAELAVVDRIAVVLGGDVALVRESVYHRLHTGERKRDRDSGGKQSQPGKGERGWACG